MAAAITPEVVQSVRDVVDVIDVASAATQLKKAGKRYQGLCPFHKEKTPSFSVDPSSGLYYCFGCGAGGDAIKLHMELTGDDFPAAIEALARRYGIALAEGPGRRERRGPDLANALEAAAEFFRTQLARSEFARSYLERRGIPGELQERYGLGYAPDGWRHLLEALGQRVPIDQLEAAGLVARSDKGSNRPYDRFRNRLMFPIHTPSGQLVGFGGRTLGDDKAKYVNTSETARFHKGDLLYGLHQAKRQIRDGRRALLVEGYFDVIGAAAAGLDWAVAGMGTSLTAPQARLLGRYAEEVVVAYDGDSAGEKAFQRALPLLLAEGLGVRRARFPEGHDPDSLRQEEGAEAVARVVESAQDAVALEIARLTPDGERSPTELSRAASQIVEILKPLRDPIARRAYTRRAAQDLGVPEDLLLGRLGRQHFAASAERKGEVRTEEERTLALLLAPEAEIPPEDLLPPPEIFFDGACRNIYASFCDLYRSGGGVPALDQVLSRLDHGEGAIDRLARLLLQVDGSGEGNPAESLDRLTRRWQKQRSSDLIRQIRQAQQQGDAARLSRLLEEKQALSRRLHPNTTGTPR